MKIYSSLVTIIFLLAISTLTTAQNNVTKGTVGWKLGLALYSYNASSLPEQLLFAKKSGVKFIEGFSFGQAGAELKDSIIMNLSPVGLLKIKELIKQSGLQMESMYVTGGNTIDQWKRDFEIAKANQSKQSKGSKAKQSKASKAKQGKASKAKQSKQSIASKAKQSKAKQAKQSKQSKASKAKQAMQSKASAAKQSIASKAKQAKQSKAKQSKAKQSKQCKAKQSKASDALQSKRSKA